jgi:8-oxo-dGTP diphosphatase
MDSQDSATLARGQQVITACAAIHKVIDGKPAVLLAKRAETKKFLPGKYELPGGHIDFGEQPEEGLARELMEELQLEVVVGDVFSAFTYVNEVKESHSVELLYFAQAKEGSEPQANPSDHSELTWFTEDTIEQLRDVNGADDAEYPHVVKALELLKNKKKVV